MIHSTAIIHTGARIGSGVAIGAYSIVGDKVTIHDDVEIAGHKSALKAPARLAAAYRIFPFASLGQAPQDLKYKVKRPGLSSAEEM
ncbi:MAG: hypothetical protein IPJ07_23565 [Acidobacteria bacterium]|nr:hypothetical protein [Acidobacteriota bacterium]